MASSPKFSVIIPCYKAERTLPGTLSSVLDSSLKDLEVICINDASPDNTLLVLRAFRDKDPRVKIIDLETNQGAAAARNAGLDAARGEIIGFVDSDDTIDDTLLEDIYARMQETRSDINIISFKFVKPDGVVYSKALTRFIARWGSDVQRMDSVDKLIFLSDYCWSLSLRRSFWERHKTYFPAGVKCSEDQCFWKPLELAAERISLLNAFGYNYHWMPDSLTKQEMSSVASIQGHDEMMRRLPPECHLAIMEKCYQRIHGFPMKNKALQNRLKRSYVRRMYQKAREVGAAHYEIPEYDYSIGKFIKVFKDRNRKKVVLFGIPLYKMKYSRHKTRTYILGIKISSRRWEDSSYR